MVDKKSAFIKSINEASEKITRKCLAFGEAYIFILNSSVLASKTLQESRSNELDKDKRSFISSYIVLHQFLKTHDVTDYYFSLLFIDLIGSAERYLIDVLTIILKRYPMKLGNTEFKLSEILDLSSNDELILIAAEKKINGLLYKKPNEYLKEFCNLLSINESLILPYWNTYIEAKARRDLGVHNEWICNEIYLRKAKELGNSVRYKVGDFMMPDYSGYAKKVSLDILQMSYVITEAVTEKHS